MPKNNMEHIAAAMSTFGVTAKKAYELFSVCGVDGDDFVEKFTLSEASEKIIGAQYKALVKFLREDIEQVRLKLEKCGAECVTVFSNDFPQALKEIDDPPYALFCRGNTDLLCSNCFAVIGTRKISYYGKRAAEAFASKLTERFTIVSGLAYGADTAAHEGALKADGNTIAVFGSGLNVVYPSANENLAQKIVEKGGLLVSEYGLDAEPLPYRFPQRNRIVSGLSRGLLVCQAPLKSGTFTTVNLALEQGRDIFVIPGEIYDVGFSGSNSLIKSMQGAFVTSACDILEYYGYGGKNEIERSKPIQLDFQEQSIVDALSLGKLSFSEIVLKTGMAVSDINFLLAKLELKSIIAKLPGNFYRLYGGM